METKYVVHFQWTGEGYLFEHKDATDENEQELFVMVYNEYANRTNQKMDQWNQEADDLGYEGSEDPESDYMKFMCGKFQHTLEEMDNDFGKGTILSNVGLVRQNFYVDENAVLHFKTETTFPTKSWRDLTFYIEGAA